MKTLTTMQPGQKAEPGVGYQVRWYVPDASRVYQPHYWSICGLGGIAQARFDHAEMIAQDYVRQGREMVEILDSRTGVCVAAVEPVE